jgi:hypothetical protein
MSIARTYWLDGPAPDVGRGHANGSVNINQVDPKYLSARYALLDNVPNPFFGSGRRGLVRDARDAAAQPVCCGPTRSSTERQPWSTAPQAKSQYNAA